MSAALMGSSVLRRANTRVCELYKSGWRVVGAQIEMVGEKPIRGT